jgi:hypothetical protein
MFHKKSFILLFETKNSQTTFFLRFTNHIPGIKRFPFGIWFPVTPDTMPNNSIELLYYSRGNIQRAHKENGHKAQARSYKLQSPSIG